MGVFRKENGSIIRKSGIAVVDLILNKLSSHAVANSAVTAKFEEVDDSIIKINNDLTNLNTDNNQKITRKYIKVSDVSVSPTEYVFTNQITRNGVDIKAIHGAIKYSQNFYPLSYNDGNFGFAIRIVDSGASIKLINATGPISVDVELVVDFVYTS